MNQYYRIWIRSVPGFMAQYDGYVDVLASSESEAISRAFEKLRRGAFPDRDRSCWRVERVEIPTLKGRSPERIFLDDPIEND